MNIAVVGGGIRCCNLINLIENHDFYEISPQIVAVADSDPEAPGLAMATERGLFVTADYNDFFQREDIELILELVGSMDIYNDILDKKSRSVRAISNNSAKLFWEIARIAQQQRQTDMKLQKARSMYETVLNDLINEDVLVIGENYRILDVNESMLDKIGMTREQVIGRHCYEITHHQATPCSGKDHPCPLVDSLRNGKASQATHIHLDKNGRKLHYSISCYPLFENEHPIGAIEISRDITKDINLQKSMLLQEKMASIGRLSAGVAHEINNPLTTILTTAMLIQEDLDRADPIYEELDTITNETLRCRKIVTSLLDFARQSKSGKKPSDVNAIVRESLMLTQKQAAFADVAIAHEYAKRIPLIRLDKGQIQQALINLIINAVEASSAGDTVQVTTRFEPINCMAEIEIKDTGTGMDDDTMERIFDPFFTLKEGGNGLGLAITHGLIEQHDGAIEVRSKPGEGAIFIVRMPVDPALKGIQDG